VGETELRREACGPQISVARIAEALFLKFVR